MPCRLPDSLHPRRNVTLLVMASIPRCASCECCTVDRKAPWQRAGPARPQIPMAGTIPDELGYCFPDLNSFKFSFNQASPLSSDITCKSMTRSAACGCTPSAACGSPPCTSLSIPSGWHIRSAPVLAAAHTRCAAADWYHPRLHRQPDPAAGDEDPRQPRALPRAAAARPLSTPAALHAPQAEHSTSKPGAWARRILLTPWADQSCACAVLRHHSCQLGGAHQPGLPGLQQQQACSRLGSCPAGSR